jgi:hypothetical protein
MATFSTISMEEARRAVLPPRRAVQEAYRGYVRNLGPDGAGRLELEGTDRPITERARLKAAAKSEGINLHIQRRGPAIVFWISDEPPRTRAKAAPKAPTSSAGRGRKRG